MVGYFCLTIIVSVRGVFRYCSHCLRETHIAKVSMPVAGDIPGRAMISSGTLTTSSHFGPVGVPVGFCLMFLKNTLLSSEMIAALQLSPFAVPVSWLSLNIMCCPSGVILTNYCHACPQPANLIRHFLLVVPVPAFCSHFRRILLTH